ncbi:MAG TPA: dihydroneopterin aldolase [Aromatoleum sp.]|uniref:dihydroneopterin aldolase n=1 Tax=Aromatoleum sp. TaxID=2307007 RepID=UPI002B4A9C59|nr:dihydroneopterin aldolase [Aromatoleum sp.]HJV26958.1 dihydroneopterin aldolase [Aromatoleum sp.]
MNAIWNVKIDRLETLLAVGLYEDEREAQPVWVSVTLTGLAPAVPDDLDGCLDYEPLCRWLVTEWPRTRHTPLLETRVNEVFDFAFDLDPRVQEVSVGLYKQRVSRFATAVGIERTTNRGEHTRARQHAAARNQEVKEDVARIE